MHNSPGNLDSACDTNVWAHVTYARRRASRCNAGSSSGRGTQASPHIGSLIGSVQLTARQSAADRRSDGSALRHPAAARRCRHSSPPSAPPTKRASNQCKAARVATPQALNSAAMTLVSKTYWGGMPFWFRRTPDNASAESLILRAHDMRQFRALYWTDTKHPRPRIGVVVIHPRVDFAHHYSVPRLIAAGFGVLAANTRHAGNGTMAGHEEMVCDVAAFGTCGTSATSTRSCCSVTAAATRSSRTTRRRRGCPPHNGSRDRREAVQRTSKARR